MADDTRRDSWRDRRVPLVESKSTRCQGRCGQAGEPVGGIGDDGPLDPCATSQALRRPKSEPRSLPSEARCRPRHRGRLDPTAMVLHRLKLYQVLPRFEHEVLTADVFPHRFPCAFLAISVTAMLLVRRDCCQEIRRL